MRSGRVTAVKFASEGIVASSSTDGSTKFWDLGTGQETEKTAEAVPEGFTFPNEGGAKPQRINSYVVAAKGQTLVIHKAPEDKAETAADGKAGTETPVAFLPVRLANRSFRRRRCQGRCGLRGRAGAAAVRGGAAAVV